MSYLEGYDCEEEGHYDVYDNSNYDVLCSKVGQSYAGVNDRMCDDVSDESGRTENSESCKRKAENDDNNNRFIEMSKRFKAAEICDQNIDSVLASNVNELLRNGIDEAKYTDIV
jgi:NADH:ubiquinone oxidoreductase subunit D